MFVFLVLVFFSEWGRDVLVHTRVTQNLYGGVVYLYILVDEGRGRTIVRAMMYCLRGKGGYGLLLRCRGVRRREGLTIMRSCVCGGDRIVGVSG